MNVIMKKQCPLHPTWRLRNVNTNIILPFDCSTYSCPVCGIRKKLRLQDALQKYLSNFNYLRLWTFTLSSAIFPNVQSHYKIISEAWRRFTNNMRRNKSLTKTQRNFQYVKVTELHVSGFTHFHVMINIYLPWVIVFNIWKNCVIEAARWLQNKIQSDVLATVECTFGESPVTSRYGYIEKERLLESVNYRVPGENDKFCFCFAKGKMQSVSAAKYVTKYIMKNLQAEVDLKIHHWSKSGKISLFEHRLKEKGWSLEKNVEYSDDILYLYGNSTPSPMEPDLSGGFFEDMSSFDFLEMIARQREKYLASSA